MCNQDCNAMLIHVLSFFSLLFLFFTESERISRNFIVAAADARQDCWLIKGASLGSFRGRRWNPGPGGTVSGWLLWKWDPRSVCRQSLPLKWQILFYLCDVGSSKRAGTFVSGYVQACAVSLMRQWGCRGALAFSTPVQPCRCSWHGKKIRYLHLLDSLKNTFYVPEFKKCNLFTSLFWVIF